MEAYASCHESFTRYCTVLAYGKMEVEDLTQEVLLSAYEHFDNIHKKDQLLPYLIRAARYRSINNWRKSKFKPELLSKHHEKLGTNHSSIERALDTQLLYQALDQLPEKQRDAIILYEITGFSMKEIAQIHNSTEGAVKTKISRGRQKLRKIMEDKPRSRFLMGILAIPDVDYFANHPGLRSNALAECFPNKLPQMDMTQVEMLIESKNLDSPPRLSKIKNATWLKTGLSVVILSGLLIWISPQKLFSTKNNTPIQQVQNKSQNVATEIKLTSNDSEQVKIPAFISKIDQPKVQLVAQTPNSILRKVHNKLKSLKTFQYELRSELDYPSDNYHEIFNWTCYYDYSLTKKPLRFKYQVEGTTYKWIYNGTEKFVLDKSAETIKVNRHPTKKEFQYPFLYNSIIALRNVLPLIIRKEDVQKKLKDTLIDNHNYKLVTVNMGKQRFEFMGNGFKVFPIKRNFIYQIIIHPDTYLPVEILLKNDLDNHIVKTNFTNLNTNPATPSEASWYYTTYTKEFDLISKYATPKQLSLGSLAPDWKLKMHQGNKEISLRDLKGKLVVMNFWIKNCEPCIATTPYFNQLREKFKQEGLEVLGINAYDTKADINKFVHTHKVSYPVLLNGKNIAEKYGVNEFPTLFIIDKSGKVVYAHSGDFDESTILEIEKAIKKTL